MVNCVVIIVSLAWELEGSILDHALFTILCSKGYNTVKCNDGVHMEYVGECKVLAARPVSYKQ